MATLDERFQKGLEMRGHLAGGQGRIYKGAVPAAYDLAPDMYRISTESLYGSIWSRPGLEIRYRAMATLTAAATQLTTQHPTHIRNPQNVGSTPEDSMEIPGISAVYGCVRA